MSLFALDICAGLGGATAAMRDRGWRVVTVDVDPAFETDIVADIRAWSWTGERPDLIWMSPPCDEFSRESMPWSKTGKQPDMSIVRACLRIVEEVRPRFWVLENVRGAARWFRPLLGERRAIYGAFYLWGHFPDIGRPAINYRKKESMSSTWRAERAMVPYALSRAMALAIERQGELLPL